MKRIVGEEARNLRKNWSKWQPKMDLWGEKKVHWIHRWNRYDTFAFTLESNQIKIETYHVIRSIQNISISSFRSNCLLLLRFLQIAASSSSIQPSTIPNYTYARHVAIMLLLIVNLWFYDWMRSLRWQQQQQQNLNASVYVCVREKRRNQTGKLNRFNNLFEEDTNAVYERRQKPLIYTIRDACTLTNLNAGTLTHTTRKW